MIKNLSLKKQFIWNFIFVILSSLILSILTYGVFLILIDNNVIIRSDYYEKKIPGIVDYINKKGEVLLNVGEKYELEKNIPLHGIEYAVLDNKNQILYGTIKSISNKDIETISHKEDRRINRLNEVRLYVPIVKKSSQSGLVILKYVLKPTAANPKFNFLVPSELLIFLSPFIYITIFTWIFSKKFSNSINMPIKELINASKKIQERQLDFSITYNAPNELGELSQSFESMRRELNLSLNRQWEIEQDRREMVSAIAHDLRTPLTIIKGHTEVLQNGNLNNKDRVERYLGIIEENTNRAIKLIEDINTLSKIERIDFQLSSNPIDIINFIYRKSEGYRVLCDEKSIKFNVLIEDKRNFNNLMEIDDYRISQVLDNIILNSFRFTEEGGNISLKAVIEQQQISFTIKDSGPGFSQGDLKNIFKKFYQGDPTRSKEKGHSGLGLYIVKNIIEKHNGYIQAENNMEGGACINFNIKCLK